MILFAISIFAIIIPATTIMIAYVMGFIPDISFQKVILIVFVRTTLVVIIGQALLQFPSFLRSICMPFVVGTIVTSLFISSENDYSMKKSLIQGMSVEAMNAFLGIAFLII